MSLAFILRFCLTFWYYPQIDASVFILIKTFLIGFCFDIGTISFFALPYVFYLLIIPKKLYGSIFDRVVTYIAYSIGLLIFLFSFFAEITFWEEFERRFNFIAVDYLIYTYEVVKNINESYPIPLLLSAILSVLFVLIFITKKANVFKKTFDNDTVLKQKLIPSLLIFFIASIFVLFIKNEDAEQFKNRYNNELAKTGIYSFFAAFKSNELSYTEFYKTIDEDKAFSNVKQKLTAPNSEFLQPKGKQIYRTVTHADSINPAQKPNVIFICIESLSASYLNSLGSELKITPTLDSLSNESLFFTNLYATGTRTVRGMEAITLSIPPTPGRSIVKRDNNTDLFTIGEVFKQQGYERNFFYGGDGYFDNMNTYFGGNEFNIIDRGRGFLLDSDIKTKRTNIDDDEVTFENAWGVCDEDIYSKVLKEADEAYLTDTPFFNFVMTTSNHRPFTYPDNKIDIPSGTSREGAIEYTDYAIGSFLNQAKTKPWFSNTVFVIMADHCASSAGRWNLNIDKYRIPAMIFNLEKIAPQKIEKLSSQIDVFPTLFALLNWDYTSNLFGLDIMKMKKEDERAFIGNYRNLGLLKDQKLMILSDQHIVNYYEWETDNDNLIPKEINTTLLEETISFYQVADYLYRNNGLKLKNN
ncbi:sulfatase-like hydrolase/transferase [Mariniflexile litorale]|uniref:Sulfatase-like hydrolase/transferase n=1 Tax=Mariniflexile litorale TaxID=3045158 RepID=A0AAU7EFY0_9FLAO|nr:sulfatase-like hydrolase/transferase [Mariniflexile sp. KMM 9835]MDQ8211607.1 sulfatase-like hydrolase/transferase [Mariniflexile sp. KMM 9835]